MAGPAGVIDASEDFDDLVQVLHVANFIPVNWGAQDRVSRSIVDFQYNREPQTQQWIRLAESALPAIPCDVIVRALSSKESTSNGKYPLDLLCQHLSRRLNVPFAPERLWKFRRTGAVKNAGGKAARLKMLFNAYEFYGSSLPPHARVLIVDDLITTGATASSIAAAIRKELPDAEVRLFALARTDPHLVQAHLERFTSAPVEEPAVPIEANPHLDEKYFFRSASPSLAQPPVRPRKTPPITPPVLPRPPAPRVELPTSPAVIIPADKIFGEEELPVTDSGPVPPPRVEPASVLPARPRAVAQVPQAPAGTKRFLNPVFIGIGAAVIVFIGFFLMNQLSVKEPGRQELPPPETTVPPVVETKPQPSPIVAPPKKDRRPRGLINVPSIGLRAGPTIDTTILQVDVKEGEEVVILQTVSAAAGPDWLQIRTKGGAVGWVFTGVVTPDTSNGRRR
jgi:hypothetical protein